ncbi:MAG: alpha/beta hydrolase, partial [Balneolaceae bacterium]
MSLFRITQNKPVSGPHQGQPVAESGAPASRAKAAMIMLHGRGATAKGILSLSDDFAQPDVRYLAPQADARAWYPYPFTDPVEKNEPWLNSALQQIYDLINQLHSEGVPTERIVLLGFSQGACLAQEYAARHPMRYGGVIGLSGGLIGEAVNPELYTGSLQDTPILIGAGENDPWFDVERIHQSADVFQKLNGNVTKEIYPGKGHTIVEDEV